MVKTLGVWFHRTRPSSTDGAGVIPRGSGFHRGSDSKEAACSAGDLGSIPESGRSPEEGKGSPFQYYGLENPMDRGAWRAAYQSMWSQRVGHDRATNTWAWRRLWVPSLLGN